MKKLIAFLIIAMVSLSSFSQTVQTITPSDGDEVSAVGSIVVNARLDEAVKTAYAVVFSLNPVGKTKTLKGKNKNLWAGVAWPSSMGYYELTTTNIITPGDYTLRVDVYGTSFRDLTDTQEVTFTVTE